MGCKDTLQLITKTPEKNPLAQKLRYTYQKANDLTNQ